MTTGSRLSVLLALAACAAAQPYRVAIEHGVMVPMRDGVKLAADIYRPEAPGRFPVLLQRTPYNRAGEQSDAAHMAREGYVVVIQDTRGRFDSEGEFYPFRCESPDGYDTVEWAAALPYSDGKVGMFGGSYVGATQWLAALAKPPHLVAIFPYVTASEYYEGWTYQGGALEQWFASSWSSGLAVDTLRRQAAGRNNPKDWVTQLPVESYRMLDLPSVSGLVPYFRDWVQHEQDDSYWKPWKISDHYGELNIKVLNSGGWHDIFLGGTIRNYTGMREHSPARSGQRLMLGPWAHTFTSPEGKIGDVTFGKGAVLDTNATTLSWFDYALKGKANEYASGPPVRIFVMGENVWRSEQEFPLARTRYTNYYLRGGGSLAVDAPAAEDPQKFVYDPADPAPTIGGRLCCSAPYLPGPYDQRPLGNRGDVLVFSTPRLSRDLEVTGPIKLQLFAASSAVDTDFTAILADVDATGYARFLTDGIVRARFRNSTAKAEPIEPGKIYEFTIDLWATSNVFRIGHSIRVYVSSSSFPRFNRNANTGEPVWGGTRMVPATQTIYHDSGHPSALVLPVIPR
jgi:hypothetical protein